MMHELYDASLTDPADDLLGVAPSARILAARLQDMRPPFTVGIYGEWGSGKTSFVSFVEHYLHELNLRPNGTSAAQFIPFSAWPYKSADEVWRSLILAIARSLLGLPDSPTGPLSGTPPQPGDLASYIKTLLAKGYPAPVIIMQAYPLLDPNAKPADVK